MRRSTIVFLLLFVIAAGAYSFLNNRKQAENFDVLITPEPTSEVSFLFDAADGVPTSIRIESKTGEIVDAARNAENAWALVLPFEASADQALAEEAASQVTTMRVQDRVPNIDLEVLGLQSPEYILTIKFTSGVERKTEVGVITPSEGGYYVRNEAGEILIVSRDSVDSLLGMLTTPPYAETPTPSPTATASPTPLPSPTPESVTPANETTTPQP